MTGKTKSILLQVAFKGAVELNEPTPTKITQLYEILVELHEKFGIDPDEGRSSGSGRSSNRSTSSAPRPQGETFIFNGILVEDFRAAKAAPGSTMKPNYPDFRTVNGEVIEGVTTPRGAAWLYDQDGQPNEAVKELVTAADGRPI